MNRAASPFPYSYYPGLAGCFRISVGSGAALRATRQALNEILEKTS